MWNRVKCVETGVVYDSIEKCRRDTGITAYYIRQICDGKLKSKNGLTFILLPPLTDEEKKQREYESYRKYYQKNKERYVANYQRYRRTHSQQIRVSRTKRLKKLRKECLDLLGGKCENCGTTEQLEFHHINKNDRKFSVSSMAKYSKEKIFSEVKKCKLLCHKCHWDEHRKEKRPYTRHKVLCIDNGKIYNTPEEVAKDLNVRKKSIYNVCVGEQKSTKGYHFKFVD